MSLVRVGLVVASMVVLTAAVGACSDETTPPAEAGPSPYCPTSFSQANGAACTEERLRCDYFYTCGSFAQASPCTCTNGKFECVDATNNVVVPGDPPVCAPVTPPAEACPATLVAADRKPCMTPEKQCNYLGVTCLDGIQRTNVCLCKQTADGGGFAYKCEIPICPQ